MNGFSFSAEQQELCAGQGSRGSYDSFGREGLHSRESMRSRSSVFTVLDSTQGALEDFAAQEPAYRASVLPDGVPTVSVEAGVTFGWDRWSDRQVGIDRFGVSAPGSRVMAELGITPAAVVAVVEDLLA